MRSVKAYAHDLKGWFRYLGARSLEWRAATVEDVAGFVAWPRLPPQARYGRVTVLPGGAPLHGVQREPQARRAELLPRFHARHGVDLGSLLVTMRLPGRRGGSSYSRSCTT